jgi:biotin-dependent carboxylase-like uncharacterized protein
MIRIVRPGLATSLQDLGRPGWAHVGVGRAGALDRDAARLANRLVGNPEWAPLIETAGELEIEAIAAVVVADTVRQARTTVRAGSRLHVPVDQDRTWSYLAVRGGLVVETALGSSYDTLARLGPPPPLAGDTIAVGPDPGHPMAVEHAAVPLRPRPVRVWPGPRHDVTAAPFETLVEARWTVRGDVSRVGVRLDGPSIDPPSHDWASEALVPGAVQLPPDGRPFVMLADHPVTGGYPVIGVVEPDDLVVVTQTRPGRPVTFRPADT